MGIGEVLTELATAATTSMKIILPGAAESIVSFGEKLVYSGEGDARKVTVVFGMAILGGVISFGVSCVKKLAKKLF